MFRIKQIGIISATVASVLGGSMTLINESQKNKLKSIVANISFDFFDGKFIKINSYDPVDYEIDENIFRQEINSLLNNKKITYRYSVSGKDVKVIYKYKGKSLRRVYHLQLND